MRLRSTVLLQLMLLRDKLCMLMVLRVMLG